MTDDVRERVERIDRNNPDASAIAVLARSRVDPDRRDLVDAQEQGNFDQAVRGGGGGALGGTLLGLGAIGGPGAGLTSFLKNFKFEPPTIPPLEAPNDLPPVPVPNALDPVGVPVPKPLDPADLPVPEALDPVAIPEPEWLPIDIPAPGESPSPTPSSKPLPVESPTNDRTTDDTPAPVTNPMADLSDTSRPTGETGVADPQNQPSPAPTPDPSGDGSGTGEGSGFGIGDVVAGGGTAYALGRLLGGSSGAGAGAAVGSSVGIPAIGSQLASRSDLLPDLPTADRTQTAMTASTPTASNTESISARASNVSVENDVTVEGADEREIERKLESAKRDILEQVRREMLRGGGP